MTTAEKDRLRATLLAARRARSDDALAVARTALCRQVLERLGDAACVAAYEPLRTEPGSLELLTALHERTGRVLVPITLADRDLDWAPWSPSGRGEPLGVAAVAAAEVVLTPALAVGRDGTRLGRGGGSYDRALARCARATLRAALLFDGEVLDAVPRDPWDEPVGFAVTPSGWVALGRNTGVALPG